MPQNCAAQPAAKRFPVALACRCSVQTQVEAPLPASPGPARAARPPFYALFSATFRAYIENCRREPAMAINGRRNKPIGPGGSTRRLHH